MQLFQRGAVGRQPRGLRNHRLAPTEPKPDQIPAHRVDEFRPAAVAVEIVVAQQQFSARRGGPLRRDPERARVPEVKESGGRGREASAVGWASGVHDGRLRAKNALAVRKSSRDVPRPALVGYSSGQRGQTVNLLAYAFGGSNPPPSTRFHEAVKRYRR